MGRRPMARRHTPCTPSLYASVMNREMRMESPAEPLPPAIDRVIVDAVLAGRLRAGMRLGEQALATLFQVSRTSVREALIRLETRGIVQVSPRRGWFVVEPSLEEAQDAFQARIAIETGLLRTAGAVEPRVVGVLRDHIDRERASIAAGDIGERSF